MYCPLGGNKALIFMPMSYISNTVVFRFKQGVGKSTFLALNQTLFSLFLHFGKSEILPISKILLKKLNVL